MAGLYRVTVTSGESEPVTSFERIIVVEDTPTRIDLQHLLLLGDQGESVVLKLWRQRWEYDPDTALVLREDGSRGFAPVMKAEPQQWTRTVFDADDSPISAEYGPWNVPPPIDHGHVSPSTIITVFGNNPLYAGGSVGDSGPAHSLALSIKRGASWKMTIGREPGARGPYDFDRGNQKSWATVTFERRGTLPSDQASTDYWKQTGDYWAAVRGAWDRVLQQSKPFTIREEVDGQPLWKRIFALAEAARVEPEAQDWPVVVVALLDEYVVFNPPDAE